MPRKRRDGVRGIRRELRRVKSGEPLPGVLGKFGFKFEVLTWGKRKIGVYPVHDLCPAFEKLWGRLRGRK